MNAIDPTRIIVGVDGSDSSIDALRRGAQIADALHAPLQVTTTWKLTPMLGAYVPPSEWSPENDARKIAAAAIERVFPDAAPANISTVILQGSAAALLIEESRHASMLVLGSRGHGGFTALLLGSVSAACAEHAHCPVLIMHKPQQAESALPAVPIAAA